MKNNNDDSEKAQGFAGGVRQNKITYIGVLTQSPKIQKIESPRLWSS